MRRKTRVACDILINTTRVRAIVRERLLDLLSRQLRKHRGGLCQVVGIIEEFNDHPHRDACVADAWIPTAYPRRLLNEESVFHYPPHGSARQILGSTLLSNCAPGAEKRQARNACMVP